VVSPMTAGIVVDDAHNLAGAQEVLGRTALLGRPIQPADVAAGILYLASDDAAFVTGAVLPVDAGLTGASWPSPYTSGRYAKPVALLEAGRRIGGEE